MENRLRETSAAVIGGVNLDICARPHGQLRLRDSNPGRVSLRPGGVGRNIAHDLLLMGVPVSLLAAFGGDADSAALLRGCRELGMDMSMAQVFPELGCCRYLYVTDRQGDMLAAVSDMEPCARLTPRLLEPLLPGLERAGALVLDANLPEETIAFICARTTAPVYADPVSVAKAGRLLPVLDRLSAIKPNALEAEALTGESDPERAARALTDRGVKRVFVSLGSGGMIAAQEGRLLRRPCPPTALLDSTGAGDAATAAIVRAGLLGLGLERSLEDALRAGALSCQCALPNVPELREL